MEQFKNSFYNVAVEAAKQNNVTAGGQLQLIDDFTRDAPMISSICFSAFGIRALRIN
jgi:hypothetical protein